MKIVDNNLINRIKKVRSALKIGGYGILLYTFDNIVDLSTMKKYYITEEAVDCMEKLINKLTERTETNEL